jgi:hypothetical protein
VGVQLGIAPLYNGVAPQPPATRRAPRGGVGEVSTVIVGKGLAGWVLEGMPLTPPADRGCGEAEVEHAVASASASTIGRHFMVVAITPSTQGRFPSPAGGRRRFG